MQVSPTGHLAFERTCELRNALVARALTHWTPSEVDTFAASLARFSASVLALDDDTVDELAATSTATAKDRR